MYTTNDVRTNSLITAFWESHACGIGWINYSNLHNYIDYFIGVFFYLRTLVYMAYHRKWLQKENHVTIVLYGKKGPIDFKPEIGWNSLRYVVNREPIDIVFS